MTSVPKEKLASFQQRFIAHIIDMIAAPLSLVLVWLPVGLLMVYLGVTSQGMALLATYGFALVSPLIYFPVMEARTGQTLGKSFLDIKVVQVDGSDIGAVRGIVRNSTRIGFWGWLPKAFAAFFILSNDDRKRLGDMLASTQVVEVEG